MVSREKKKEILELHTDAQWGSAYWQKVFKEQKLSVDAVIADPFLMPPMDSEMLRRKPIDYFIPRKVQAEKKHVITGETSGFSGKPIVTVFSEEEFHNGFITPFLEAAEKTHFPVTARWLWIGPSGPHIIGKAVREILRVVGGMDPFSIDFDPRWYRKMVEGSLSRERYFSHLKEQIFSLLSLQHIDVLFTTPPILTMLCECMSESSRALISGVHYGGVAMDAAAYTGFKAAFPRAVHLSGYGNSLIGVFLETACDEEGITYYTISDRVDIELITDEDGKLKPCQYGEEGRVMFSRYDETVMILNMVERDTAVKVEGGIKNPHPASRTQRAKVLY